VPTLGPIAHSYRTADFYWRRPGAQAKRTVEMCCLNPSAKLFSMFPPVTS
jgi:hypothetical protein